MGGAAREGQTEPGVQRDFILGKNNQNMVLIKDESAQLCPIFRPLTLVAVNRKKDQEVLCNGMREDSKEEREARRGLLGLEASCVLESIVDDFYEKEVKNLPDCTVGTHLVSLHSN